MAASSTAVTNPRWVQHRSVPSRPTALHPTTPHSTSTLVAHPAMHCLPACSFCAQAPWPRELAFFLFGASGQQFDSAPAAVLQVAGPGGASGWYPHPGIRCLCIWSRVVG